MKVTDKVRELGECLVHVSNDLDFAQAQLEMEIEANYPSNNPLTLLSKLSA